MRTLPLAFIVEAVGWWGGGYVAIVGVVAVTVAVCDRDSLEDGLL